MEEILIQGMKPLLGSFWLKRKLSLARARVCVCVCGVVCVCVVCVCVVCVVCVCVVCVVLEERLGGYSYFDIDFGDLLSFKCCLP